MTATTLNATQITALAWYALPAGQRTAATRPATATTKALHRRNLIAVVNPDRHGAGHVGLTDAGEGELWLATH